MKKFLMLLAAVTMLSTGTVQAFPGHGGAHFRPGPVYSYHRPGAVRHKHHRSGTALAVAGTIVGMGGVDQLGLAAADGSDLCAGTNRRCAAAGCDFQLHNYR